MSLKPGDKIPNLTLPRIGGGDWSVATDLDADLTLIEFYRGHHCPRCKSRLQELIDLQDDFAREGIACLAISMDNEETALQSYEEWSLGSLTVLYGLSHATARSYDLFISKNIGNHEPTLFCEPGTFLVKADGTLYLSARSSMPIMRPLLKEAIVAAQVLRDRNYPPRGDQ